MCILHNTRRLRQRKKILNQIILKKSNPIFLIQRPTSYDHKNIVEIHVQFSEELCLHTNKDILL